MDAAGSGAPFAVRMEAAPGTADSPWEFLQPFAFSLPETGGASVMHYNRKTPPDTRQTGFSVTPTGLKPVTF